MASLNGLQSGIDLKFSYVDVNGTQNFTLLESISFMQDAPINKQVLIDGNVLLPQFYQGWHGTMTFARNGSALDDYVRNQEANYRLGGDQIMGTINITISNPNGTVSRTVYFNVAIQLTDGGTYSGTDIVKQTVNWEAGGSSNIF